MKSLVNKEWSIDLPSPKVGKINTKNKSRKYLVASHNKDKFSILLTMVRPLAFQFTKTHEQTFTKRWTWQTLSKRNTLKMKTLKKDGMKKENTQKT